MPTTFTGSGNRLGGGGGSGAPAASAPPPVNSRPQGNCPKTFKKFVVPSWNPNIFKGTSDPSQFIFEINVGKSRIRDRTTLKLKSLTDSKSIEDDVI